MRYVGLLPTYSSSCVAVCAIFGAVNRATLATSINSHASSFTSSATADNLHAIVLLFCSAITRKREIWRSFFSLTLFYPVCVAEHAQANQSLNHNCLKGKVKKRWGSPYYVCFDFPAVNGTGVAVGSAHAGTMSCLMLRAVGVSLSNFTVLAIFVQKHPVIFSVILILCSERRWSGHVHDGHHQAQGRRPG